jgi:hypothetical protein
MSRRLGRRDCEADGEDPEEDLDRLYNYDCEEIP